MTAAVQARPTPLPARIEEWERKIKNERTLNDHVEDVHIALYDDSPDYRRLLEAVWDSDAVEGSLAIDNTMAAMMIRDKAKDMPGNPVGAKKLDTIVKSLTVVLRRYHNSRKVWRHTIEGTILPNENGTTY